MLQRDAIVDAICESHVGSWHTIQDRGPVGALVLREPNGVQVIIVEREDCIDVEVEHHQLRGHSFSYYISNSDGRRLLEYISLISRRHRRDTFGAAIALLQSNKGE